MKDHLIFTSKVYLYSKMDETESSPAVSTELKTRKSKRNSAEALESSAEASKTTRMKSRSPIRKIDHANETKMSHKRLKTFSDSQKDVLIKAIKDGITTRKEDEKARSQLAKQLNAEPKSVRVCLSTILS